MITHKEKVRIASHMHRTAEDNENNRGKFDTAAWEKRKEAIQERVLRRESASSAKASMRRDAKTPGIITRARARIIETLKRRQLERGRRREAWLRKEHKDGVASLL